MPAELSSETCVLLCTDSCTSWLLCCPSVLHHAVFMVKLGMNITTQSMQVYVGGQLEIVGKDYRYRGQISRIEIIPDQGQSGLRGQNANLHVEFEYICLFDMGRGYKPDENKPYQVALGICGVSDIGYGRTCVNSSILGEMAVFYPPNHKKRVLADGTMHVDEDDA